MSTTAVIQTRCTLQCHHCSKTIRVPELVVRRNTIELLSGHHQLASKAFVLRCRACQRESIYTTDEISDCPVD